MSISNILPTHLSVCVSVWVGGWGVCLVGCVCVGGPFPDWYEVTCGKFAAVFPGSSSGTKVGCQYGGKLCLHAIKA